MTVRHFSANSTAPHALVISHYKIVVEEHNLMFSSFLKQILISLLQIWMLNSAAKYLKKKTKLRKRSSREIPSPIPGLLYKVCKSSCEQFIKVSFTRSSNLFLETKEKVATEECKSAWTDLFCFISVQETFHIKIEDRSSHWRFFMLRRSGINIFVM